MTARLTLAALLLGAACADETPEVDPSLPSAPEADTTLAGWLADVEAALADTTQQDGVWGTVRGDAWDALDASLGLHRACDTYYDGETLVEEAWLAPGDPRRGFVRVDRLGADEAVVVAQCAYGAYQGSYVMVHVEGDDAVLAEAPVDPGASDLRAAVLSHPEINADARTVTTFAKGRGLGDCGTYSVYRLGAGAALDAVEVRARECSDDIPDDIDPSTWPVVYSASE